MIFKTFETNLSGISNKLGFNKRSFAEWSKQVATSCKESEGYINKFKNSLVTAFTIQTEQNNNWIKNKFGDIVSKNNIDSYIPKLDKSSASNLLKELQELQTQVNVGTIGWNDYFKTCKDGKKYIIDFVQNTDLQKASTEDLIKANEAARASIIAQNEALKQQTLAAKAASVATKALSMAGNMIMFAVISKAISLVVSGIDNYIHRTDKLLEAAEKAKSEIKSIESEFDDLSGSVNKTKDRFAELAQGVENLGQTSQNKGKLSTENYNEFLDLSNQLAKLFPTLTKGYDENGNAILNLSGNVDTIVGSLENLVSVQQKLANQEIIDKIPDVWAGYTVDLKEYNENLDTAEEKAKSAIKALSKITEGKVSITDSSTNALIKEALRKMEINPDTNGKLYHTLVSFSGRNRGLSKFKSGEWDFSQLTSDQIEQLKNNLSMLGSEYENSVMYAQEKIKSANAEMGSYINSWLSSEWNFSKMNTDMQSLVKDVLLNSDWLSSLPYDVDSSNWDSVSNWLEQNFLYAVSGINSENIQTALAEVFSNDFSLNSLDSLMEQILSIDGFDKNNPLIIYLQAKFDETESLKKDVRSILEREFYDKLDELSLNELKIAANLEVSEDTLLSWTELINKIKEVNETSGNSLFSYFDGSEIGERLNIIKSQFEEGELSYREYFGGLRSEIENVDFSNFINSMGEANQAAKHLFIDSVQQSAAGLSDLISSFNNGEISPTEYLESYVAIAETMSALTDNLQENSEAWTENGKAIEDSVSEALDETQGELKEAIDDVNSYIDSMWSFEQILSDAVSEGSDEFNAHVNVIAEDLARIVEEGGYMAEEIKNTLGTTTSEIAESMKSNVSNQSLALQAIMGNTNNAIDKMSSNTGNLFTVLGEQIKNFKVDVSFGVKSLNWKEVDILGAKFKLPEIKFELSASGESLTAIGNVLSLNGNGQKMTVNGLFDWLRNKKSNSDIKDYNPDTKATQNYNNNLDAMKSSSSGSGSGSSGSGSGASGSELKTNDNYYNEFQANIDDYKAAVESAENEIDDLNSRLEKAIETGNTELAKQLTLEAETKSKTLQAYLAKSAEAVRKMSEEQILPIIWETAPELKGKRYSDFTQKELLDIEKRFDDELIAAENTGADTSSVQMKQKIYSELLSTLKDIDDLVGNENGYGEWAEKWAKQIEEIIEKTKDLYEYKKSISDFNITLFEGRGDYDGQIGELKNQLTEIHNMAETLRGFGYLDTSSEIMGYQKDYLDTQNSILEVQSKKFEAEIKKNQKAVDIIDKEIESLEDYKFEKKIDLLNKELPLYEEQLEKVRKQQDLLTSSFGNSENMSEAAREEMESLEEQAVSLSESIKTANENIKQTIRDAYEYNQNTINTEISNLEKRYELLDLANDSSGKTRNIESRINSVTLSIKKAYAEIDRLRADNAEKNKDLIQTEVDRVYEATQKILSLRKEMYQSEYDELKRYIDMRDSLENWLVNEKSKYIAKTEKLVKDSYAKGLIDTKEYIEQLADIYMSEFSQYQTEQQRLQQAAVSAIEKEIEAVEKAQDTKVKALEEEIDLLEERKELLEDQLDMYDRAKSAVDTLIDEETDKLQKEIDALEEKNNQQTKAIELAEKQQALAKAEQQKTALIYRKDTGFEYESNAQELADAQEELFEYQRQQKLEAEKQAIQDRIDALNEYKDKWQEAVDAYEKAQDKIAAAAVIGAKWEEYVISLREDIIKKFGDEYYKLSDEIENSIEKQIDDLNKQKDSVTENADAQIEKLNNLKEAWSEALDIQDEIEGYAGGLNALIGAESDSYESRLALAENFAENYKRTFKDLQESAQLRIEKLYEETQSITDLLNKAEIPVYQGNNQSNDLSVNLGNANKYSNTLTNDDIYILQRMRAASSAWADTTDETLRKQLAQYNQELAKKLSFTAIFNGSAGVWTDEDGQLLYDLLKAYENGETVTVKSTKAEENNTKSLNSASSALNSSSQKVVQSNTDNSGKLADNTVKVSANSNELSVNTLGADKNTAATDDNTDAITNSLVPSNNEVRDSVDALTNAIPELKNALENVSFSNSSNTSDNGASSNALNDISGAYSAYLMNQKNEQEVAEAQKAMLDETVKKYGAVLSGNILTLSNGDRYELSQEGFQKLSSSSSGSSSSGNSGSSSSGSSAGSNSSGGMTDSQALSLLNSQYGNKAYGQKVYSTSYEGAQDIVSSGILSDSNPSRYFVVKRNNEYNIYKVQWGDGTKSTKVSSSPIGRYAKGTLGTLYNQAALVDEAGEEILVRTPAPEYGRMTYLEKGDGVIPASPTKNLMSFGINPTDFIKNHMPKYNDVNMDFLNNIKAGNETVININGDLSFPNVNSGNDVKTLIQALKGLPTAAMQRSMRR